MGRPKNLHPLPPLAPHPPRSYTAPSSPAKLTPIMIRLIFWIAVVFAAIWLWRKFNAPTRARRDEDKPASLTMVRCAQCGVHLPQDSALRRDSHWYCSQPHLEQGPSNGAR